MAKVKLGLDRMSVAELLEFAKQVVSAMTGNPNFTTPNPPLAQITTAADNLDTARQAALLARSEAKTKTTIQNQREDELRAFLRKMALYVENIGGEDEAVITSAGMNTKAPATPGGATGLVEGFNSTTGDSDGEIDLGWNSLANAASYVVEQSLQGPPNAVWTQVKTTTQSKVTITGLQSGTRYWFRVAAVGPQGQGGWSDISARIAP